MIRPRRSILYMPGSNTRAMEKARTLPVDGVILDLEDSVAPDAKLDARQKVIDAVKAGGFGHREVFVRINGIETEWGPDDLSAAASVAPCSASALSYRAGIARQAAVAAGGLPVISSDCSASCCACAGSPSASVASAAAA